MFLITPLFRWYVARQLVVTKIYQVVQYEPKACFCAFVEDGAQVRRCRDVDGAGSNTNAAKHVHDSRFHTLSQLVEDALISGKFNLTIDLNLPLLIDCFV